eukprot:gene13233-17736_t
MSQTINLIQNANLEDWTFDKWSIWIIPLFSSVILVGMEILSVGVPPLFQAITHCNQIPIKGKHLDQFSLQDHIFITINKFLTILFVYHGLLVCYYTPSVKWNFDDMNFFNTVGSLLLFYLVYDFLYMNFHKFLHLRWLYPYVHKHHHRQKAPSRGNLDAINVHPFEYVVGEYIHLVAIYFIPCHIIAVVFFILCSGVVATLNHTRLDLNLPFAIYSVKVHDVHHRLPESNYGQYTMFWDSIFGSYRSYDKNTKLDD